MRILSEMIHTQAELKIRAVTMNLQAARQSAPAARTAMNAMYHQVVRKLYPQPHDRSRRYLSRQSVRTEVPRIHGVHCRMVWDSVSGYIEKQTAVCCWTARPRPRASRVSIESSPRRNGRPRNISL